MYNLDSQDIKRAFNYLYCIERGGKPRQSGINIVIDGMDAGCFSLTDIRSMADCTAEYIDLVKLGWLTARCIREDVLEKKIELFHEFNIDVLLGGMALEYALLQGKADELLTDCKKYCIDAVEVSSSVAYLSGKRKRELVTEILDRGMKCVLELGRKGDAADITVEDVERVVGDPIFGQCTWIILESERIEMMAAEGRLEGFVGALADLNLANLVFELPYGRSFSEIVHIASGIIGEYGPLTNLANINSNHVVGIETIRSGTCFGPLFGRMAG